MNGRKAKLLRKIAKLTQRSDAYIKREYAHMDKSLQSGYLSFMRENLHRIEELRKSSSPKDTIVVDTKIGKGE